MLFNNNGLVIASEGSGTNAIQLREQIEKAGKETFRQLGLGDSFEATVRYCADATGVRRAFGDNPSARVIVIVTDGLRDIVPNIRALSFLIELAKGEGAYVFLFGEEDLGELSLPHLTLPEGR